VGGLYKSLTTASGAGQAPAGVSGEPTAAICSRSEAVASFEVGGCGPDLVAIFDDAGETRVRHAEDGERRILLI
jgi:hypothetical protein